MNTQTLLGWCLAALCAVATAPTWAQGDLHFSHTAAVPTQINPAYAGLLEAKARVGIDYRGQWNQITNAYRTASLNADGKAWENGNDVAGVGMFFNQDQAGDLDFTTQQLGITNSYLKGLDGGKSYLSFGIQNVFHFQRLDITKARAFDYESPAIVESNGRAAYWSIGTGLAFFHRFNRDLSWFAGASTGHLNRPSVGFSTQAGRTEGEFLYTRWTLHAGGEIKFGKWNSIRPSALFMKQGTHRQVNVGMYYRFKKDRGTHTDAPVGVHLGTHIRSYPAQDQGGIDAVILSARFEYLLTVITVSFDTNVSNLIEVSNGGGGPELSIVQQFDWAGRGRKRRKVECPTFQY